MIASASPEHPRNDSASVVALRDGRLFVVWMEFIQSEKAGHDEGENRIAGKLSHDGGKTWNDHRIVVEPRPGDVNVYNPGLLRLRNGEVLFSYFYYDELSWTMPLITTGMMHRSSDGSIVFGVPEPLWRRESRHNASSTLVQLDSGRIVCPIAHVPIWGGPKDNQNLSCAYSDDNGHTWQTSDSQIKLPLRGAMEGHIAETRDGRLLMAMRTQIGSVFFSESYDQGETWSLAQTSGLTSCESIPCLVNIPQTGDLLLIWNNSIYDPGFDHWGKRTPLTCVVSQDEGRTWTCRKHIEDDPAWEFSNPACTITESGKAIITYFTSEMENRDPPGRLGRTAMSLKAAIVDIDWLYA